MLTPPDLPPELKVFHQRTIKTVIPMFAGVAGAAVLMFYSKSNEGRNWIEMVSLFSFVVGMVAMIGYCFYRILLAVPDCPNCGEKMRVSDSIDEVEAGAWRIVSCDNCQQKNRIPSLTSH